MKFRKNQSGFSVVEVLLLLIFLTIIGFTGYYVYHAQKTTNKTNDTQTNTKTSSKDNQTLLSKTETPAQSYLTFTEWGVKLPTSGTLADAQYQNITSAYGMDNDTAQVTVNPSVSPGCKGGDIGWITRVPDSNTKDSSVVYYSHIGTYNYEYELPQDCMTSPDSVMTQLEQAVSHMVSVN